MTTKKKRALSVTGLALAVVLGSLLATTEASAVPQHRLRRWLGRPAIDPTIRNTVKFGQPRYRGPRVYGAPGFRKY